jgi:phytoene dehydrogenase-like protein
MPNLDIVKALEVGIGFRVTIVSSIVLLLDGDLPLFKLLAGVLDHVFMVDF